MAAITINRESSRCSDELQVRFYECPACGFARVPYGLSAWTPNLSSFDEFEREPEFDAQHCPGCGGQIVWT